jgi:hypothetical protein
MDITPGGARAVPSPAEPLARQLTEVGGQLHMVLAHMEQHLANGDSAPGAPPIPDVLASLLCDILTPLSRRRRRDVATAAAVLAQVGAVIESELHLVSRDR